MPYDSGKLRNSGGDPRVGIAQWVGRKIRHHAPLAELVRHPPAQLNQRATQTNTKDGVVMMRAADDEEFPSVIYRLADGRRFEFSVREVGEDEELGKLETIGA